MTDDTDIAYIGDPYVGVPLGHTDGCRNPDHNPVISLCTNELIAPWTC